MAVDIAVQIAADPDLLGIIREMVRSYVSRFGYPKERVDEVVLAVDEACANSIRHAYGGPCDRVFRLSLSSTKGWLQIELGDDGTPARAEAVKPKPPSDHPPDLDTIVPGGLGLQLIYGVFDKVDFRPGESQGNRVTMRLKRPQKKS